MSYNKFNCIKPVETGILPSTAHSKLKCMLVNARSLNKKTVDNLLNILFIDEKIDLCCITETWLKPGDQAMLADIKLRGYKIVSSSRANNKRGGGIAFLCKDIYQFNQIKTLKYSMFELLEVVFICKSNLVRFSTIYCTGILNTEQRATFLQELNSYLDSLLFKQGVNILWGDFNISKDQCTNKKFYVKFIDLIESKSLKLIIYKPTHVKKGILDLVFVPSELLIDNATIYDLESGVEISDHFPIKIELPLEAERAKTYKIIQHRNLDNIDLDLFKKNIALSLNCKLIQSINSVKELEDATNFLLNTLSNEIDLHSPIVQTKIKLTRHLVENLEIREARREKRKAERKFKKSKLDIDRSTLRNAKKKLNIIITKNRNNYFKRKFQSSQSNVRQTYKLVNQLLNKGKQSVLPTHTDETLLADKFAFFYNDKIKNIRNSFNNPTNNNSLFSFRKDPINTPLDKFEPISCKDIQDIVQNLVNKQSAIDVIPCSVFKLVIKELLPALHNIINTSFSTGIFPSILKTSSITPVIKNKNIDTDTFNNYRPISNISIIAKIIEKCVLKQVTNHLHINNLYTTHQSAYRPHHSCETAVIKIIDDITAQFDSDSFVIMTLLDFSAAFDTVDHKILITTLEQQFGITGTVLNWFKSYLEDRSYRVKINNTFSSLQKQKFGVPQGSILGPTLYLLYVAMIEKIAKFYNINYHIYADDVILYTNNNNLTKLKDCLNEINRWANQIFLKLNNSKTQLICLSPKNNRLTKPLNINLMGTDIKVEKYVKYLGTWLDDNLTMVKQVNHVCAQGYIMLKNLWRISSKVIDIKLRTQLIHTCILSKLNFCSSIYNLLPKKELRKLDKLLKASARFIFRICGIDCWQPMTPYLQKLHFLPIVYRSQFKISVIVYKCFKKQEPKYLTSLLLPRINNYNKNTRKNIDITWLNKHPLEKLSYKCRSFRHVAPDVWNRLSIEVRNSPSVNIFKSRLKTFYFKEWLNS